MRRASLLQMTLRRSIGFSAFISGLLAAVACNPSGPTRVTRQGSPEPVVDTLDPAAPTRLVHELASPLFSALDVAGDTAYCAVGPDGVDVIDLSSLRGK
jgi:hypothetical protein